MDDKVEPLFDIASAKIDRFLTTEPPPRRWIVKDVLPAGIVGCIVAGGGTGKSFAAIQLGVAVATGLPLFGILEVGEPGGVLILMAEDDEDELHRRLRTIIDQVQPHEPIEFYESLRRNLYLKSMLAQDNMMTAYNEDGILDSTAYVKRVAVTAMAIPNLKLIVIDPVSRFRGGDENSSQDATRFAEEVELLRQLTGTTVLLLHHVHKKSLKGEEQDQSASRGSSALTDAVRWQLNLARPTRAECAQYGIDFNDQSARRSFVAASVTKSNYAGVGATIMLRRDTGGYLVAVSAEQAAAALKHQRVGAVVAAVYFAPSAMSERRFRDTHSGKDKELGLADAALRTVIQNAIDSGYLKKEKSKLKVTERGEHLAKRKQFGISPNSLSPQNSEEETTS